MYRVHLTLSMAVGLALASVFASSAGASLYPIFPQGEFADLDYASFIQTVPLESDDLPYPNPAIGNKIWNHPGGLSTRGVTPGTFFVGVFGRPIYIGDPDAAIYVWETTGAQSTGMAGPQIEIGYWDETEFIPYGHPQVVEYFATGVNAYGYPQIFSSITPLSDFGITTEFPFVLNAVRVEVVSEWAHNQVTAVAATVVPASTVPEPADLPLVAIGFVVLLGQVWWRRTIGGPK